MKNKLTPGLILCLIIAAYWLASSLHPKPQSSTISSAIQHSSPIVQAITQTPTVQAATNTIGKNVRVPVLMYHHVGTPVDAAGFDLTVSPTDFEAQVKYFKDRGYETVTVQQVYDALENGGSLPKKPIVFSFDDGYKDVFENAVPILEKYNYTGSFAIATELLGRPTYAVWDDVIAASKQGMEILSHTENHLDLTSPVYADYDLKREIFDSKQILETKLGTKINFFVYPYGKNNPKVADLVKQAGYKMAFTTAYGQNISVDNLLTEPRVRVHGGPEGLDKLKVALFGAPHPAPIQTNSDILK